MTQMMMAAVAAAMMAVGLVGAAPTRAEAPSKPVIPSAFISSFEFYSSGVYGGTGQYYYDADAQKNHYNLTVANPFFPAQAVPYGYFYSEAGAWMYIEGICKSLGTKFAPVFSFVQSPATTYQGSKTVNGRDCDVWGLTTAQANLSVCTQNSVLVEFISESQVSTTHYMTRMLFGDDFNPSKPTPAELAVPEACFEPPVVCNATNLTAETMDVYAFQPKNQTGNIVDQDVADLRGDTVFVCFDLLSNNTANDHYAVVTNYKINVIPKWGLYRECNGYPPYCIGDAMVEVGRESSISKGPLRGQCEPNLDYGSWLSMPSMGYCQDGPLDLAKNCSWQVASVGKTISGACLIENPAFLQACSQIVNGSIDAAVDLFKAAFDSEDPSKNGCPAL
ncbi:uncharacterized protein MONBRDRAFT_25666 [Monosiga brevicollis MX1]|uniref:Uncharacterized protein n=1 Tax=Monosiga brevicollis TaxID=81824 RepID=A9V025_MONBE|nr:uncharacterized protein MONBRDRAFT_25666 [Monosiga brevicollis MX1]EDQ88937.1 predicted protein [Monosiga brevicollis MX1]|eukprot:XP_001746042.1 hypothetical protein [Monosiga brevicollis MX1]